MDANAKMTAVVQNIFTVNVCFACMVWMVKRTSIFEQVVVELGFEHYAETPVQFGDLSIMPMNTTVNIMYVFIGLYWLCVPFLRHQNKFPKIADVWMVTVMAWMGILYGPVQSWRIICQTRPSAVLDQWCTFPFFMWVVIWCKSIDCKANINVEQYIPLMIVSITSYFGCIYLTYGFELILAVHILAVIYYAVHVQKSYGNDKTGVSFAKAFLCCCGFILLKLLDLRLGKFTLFQFLSGHFWSKICDVLQLHYVCQFLTEIAFLRTKAG